MTEVYILRFLFIRKSEMDKLYKLLVVLGSPSKAKWPEGHKLAESMEFDLTKFQETLLYTIIKNAPIEAIDLMKLMLKYNTDDRLTTSE